MDGERRGKMPEPKKGIETFTEPDKEEKGVITWPMRRRRMEKQRILWMDIAKAFGILIVLIVHGGIGLGPVTFLGGMFYMPVFFVLAGMTFKRREGESFGAFMKKKARRLLVPYFGYNLFLFLFFFVKDGLLVGKVSLDSFFPFLGILYSRNCLFGMDAAYNIYFMQILNAPTWFLTGLFVSLMIFWVLMEAAKGELRKLYIMNGGVLLLAVLLHYFCPVLLPWSIDCAMYAVSFLTLGKALQEYGWVEKLSKKPAWLLLLAAAFVGLSFVNGSVNMSVGEYGRSMVLYLLVGGLGSLLCMELSLFVEKYMRVLAGVFAWLGRHTVPVLCMHLFAYSVIGMLLF